MFPILLHSDNINMEKDGKKQYTTDENYPHIPLRFIIMYMIKPRAYGEIQICKLSFMSIKKSDLYHFNPYRLKIIIGDVLLILIKLPMMRYCVSIV